MFVGDFLVITVWRIVETSYSQGGTFISGRRYEAKMCIFARYQHKNRSEMSSKVDLEVARHQREDHGPRNHCTFGDMGGSERSRLRGRRANIQQE